MVDDPAPRARTEPLVPDDFDVPLGLRTDLFVLEPLDVIHNVADYRAWTSSVEHIRTTPGFPDGKWPDPALTLEDNERDLARHAGHFARRVGFTYTVLDPSNADVIGCVYIYPTRAPDHDVDVRSWTRADKADLDKPLYETVQAWLRDVWPFQSPEYAPR